MEKAVEEIKKLFLLYLCQVHISILNKFLSHG